MTTLFSAYDWTVRAENIIRRAGYNFDPPACIYYLINDILEGKIQCGAKTLEEYAEFEIKYFGFNETPVDCVKYHMWVLTQLNDKIIRDYFIEFYSKK